MLGKILQKRPVDEQPTVEWTQAFKPPQPTTETTADRLPLSIDSLAPFSDLEVLLRDVRLKGDPIIKIYERAVIHSKRLSLSSLSPLALYALDFQIAQHTNLFWYLRTQHNHNLFDLSGILDYTQAGTHFRLTPPIIETYQEPTTGEWVSVIIDGLHRLLAARQLGIESAWVVEIQNVPASLTPVALPVAWESVHIASTVPPSDQKRRYRFSSHRELQAMGVANATAENYQYFLYRDLTSLGSAGIRPAAA